jgi:hypothetical protein
MRLVVLVAAAALSACAQTLAVGVVGGGSPTDAFPDQIVSGAHFFSPSKDYLIGGMLDFRLNPRWSVEADGMFRELHLTTPASPLSPVVTWEFPMLAKYRFSGSRIKPFIEGGPSLRTTGNLNTRPSHYGLTTGVGVEIHWRGWNISPAARYTFWAPDQRHLTIPSAQNQVELLAGFSRATATNWRPLGSHLSIGVVLGTNLTDDLRGFTEPPCPPPCFSFSSSPGPRTLIVGPTVNFKLAGGLSVEVDALSHPISSVSQDVFSGMRRFDYPSWEFPLLAKYKVRLRGVEPFLAVGPSFRALQYLNNASSLGTTAVAGVQFRVVHLTIEPGIRYTHWSADEFDAPEGARRNQSQLLVAFSF